ncbi:hypothetical protein [Algoriphagus litoralis]|uniref:hypothetical protein n=1 Tax=Algoriphagus litoralis TaxID=2202829 RepID=UPI001300BEAE|nr:hypothetical protein [Algoriphagus litoralis]
MASFQIKDFPSYDPIKNPSNPEIQFLFCNSDFTVGFSHLPHKGVHDPKKSLSEFTCLCTVVPKRKKYSEVNPRIQRIAPLGKRTKTRKDFCIKGDFSVLRKTRKQILPD